MPRYPVTIILTVLAVVATNCSALGEFLIDRVDAVALGEPWRLFTGHLGHASTPHLLFDLALFIPLLAIVERRDGSRRTLLTCLGIGLGVALGIRAIHGGWTTYAGLSGVVYGLLPVALLYGKRVSRVSWFIVIGITGKSVFEWLGDGWLVWSAFLSDLFQVRYLAGSHIAGLATGLSLVALRRLSDAVSKTVIEGPPPDTA